jgi:pyrrolysine biosynthesis protein PylD
MLSPETLIVAPGIPLGLDEEAAEQFKDQLVHDMLDIGTATMLAMAL